MPQEGGIRRGAKLVAKRKRLDIICYSFPRTTRDARGSATQATWQRHMSKVDSAPTGEPEIAGATGADAAATPAAASTTASAAPDRPSHKPPAFVGHAMKSLFESADVSIRREDETRVLSRAQEAVAELQKRKGIVIEGAGVSNAASPSAAPPARPISSAPPGPRVDVVLWVVLVAGLFAIAGWMLLYGL
jgi:hypothetical protein